MFEWLAKKLINTAAFTSYTTRYAHEEFLIQGLDLAKARLDNVNTRCDVQSESLKELLALGLEHARAIHRMQDDLTAIETRIGALLATLAVPKKEKKPDVRKKRVAPRG